MPIRENKFARRARERDENTNTKKLVNRDEQPTIDEQLARLEEDIRRLKVEFDIYFNGAAKRPPYDTKGRVETLIKRLADDRTLTFAQRYHYNSLAARYTSFLQLWRRTMQDREEGRGPLAPPRAPRSRPSPRPPPSSALTRAPTCKTVRELYQALVEARRRCGEDDRRLCTSRASTAWSPRNPRRSNSAPAASAYTSRSPSATAASSSRPRRKSREQAGDGENGRQSELVMVLTAFRFTAYCFLECLAFQSALAGSLRSPEAVSGLQRKLKCSVGESYILITFSACGPFGPCVTSNSTS